MKAQLFTLLAAAAVGTGTVQARGEYAEIARLRSMNETVRGIRSMADGEHYTILEGNNIVRYGYATAGQGEQMLPIEKYVKLSKRMNGKLKIIN